MQSGVNVKVVQTVMRHSTIKLTLDTHGHLLPGQEAEAVDGLGQFFSSAWSGAEDRDGRRPNGLHREGGTVGGAVRIARNTQKPAHLTVQNALTGNSDAIVPRKALPQNDLRATCASDACDPQLSPAGLEPTTYGLKVRCSTN